MATSQFDPDLLQLTLGEASPAAVRIVARWRSEAIGPDVQLCGSLRGPYCRYAHTLTATHALAPAREQAGAVATVIPDPCCWTPEAPYYYLAQIEVRHGDRTVAMLERPWAWRPLSLRRGQLTLEGKNWALRGAAACPPEFSDAAAPWHVDRWRETATAYLGPADDPLCRAATLRGLFVVADARQAGPRLLPELRRLANWPAVALIVVPTAQTIDAACRAAASGTLLAQLHTLHDPPEACAADVVMLHVTADAPPAEPGAWAQRCPRPVMVYRPQPSVADVAAARAGCDRLQRDLAGHGEFVGYLV